MRGMKLGLLALLALTVTSEIAEAKRKFRLPVVIPIPRTHSTPATEIKREVVKVLDLPNTAAFQQDDGTYVDLGYHFFSDEAGEWVGYTGSHRDYLSLSDAQLSGIMRLAKLDQLPPVPSRRARSSSYSGGSGGLGNMFWILLIVGFFGFRFWRKVSVGAVKVAGAAARQVHARTNEAPTGEWMAKAESRFSAAGVAHAGLAQAAPAPSVSASSGSASARNGLTSTPRSSRPASSGSGTVLRGGRVGTVSRA